MTITDEKIRQRHKAMIFSHREKARAFGLMEKANIDSDLLQMIDNQEYDIAQLEVLNHSLYKADSINNIETYISENIDELQKAISLACEGKHTLVIGDTGAGKGFATYECLKSKPNIKAIIVLPNASVVEQMGKDYKVPAIHGEGIKLVDNLNHNIVVCTWDKLVQAIGNEALKEFIVIRDEAHEVNASDFRSRVVKPLEQLSKKNTGYITGLVDITATPTRLNFDDYDYVVKYEKSNSNEPKVKLYDKVCYETIIDIIGKSNKFSLLMNDKKELSYFQTQTSKKTDIVHSKIKDKSKLHKNLIDKSSFGSYKGLLHTTCIVTGLNIKDEDVTDVIVIGMKDPQIIKQIPARYRKAKNLTLHIFNDYPKNPGYFTYLVNKINKDKERAKIVVDALNNSIDSYDDDDYICGFDLTKSNGFYYCKHQKRYVVDEASIVANNFDTYYKTRDRAQLKVLLSEYFRNLTTVSIQHDDKKKAELDKFINDVSDQAEDNLNRSEGHKDILVGCSAILDGEVLTDNQKFYLKTNNWSIDELRTTYKTLGINKMLENVDFRDTIDKYSDYVVTDNYDLDFAWRMARCKDSEVKKINLMIKALSHRLKVESNCGKMSRANKKYIENKQFNFIIDELPVGTALTREHFDMIVEKFNKKFKTKLSVKELKDFIKATYKLNRTQIKIEGGNFYKNKSPKTVTKGNKVNVEVIERFLTIDDIANILKIESINPTLLKLVKN